MRTAAIWRHSSASRKRIGEHRATRYASKLRCAGILVLYGPGIWEKLRAEIDRQRVGLKDKSRASVFFATWNILVSILNS